ncbi:MAG: RNA polymerase Rpb4 family protein [Methanosarcinaceae archaeon]|nr:RNA polymerase Rpb4 family protein [Methanosarcinaceae archaeon]
MIVKDVLEEKLLTISEVKELLLEIQEQRMEDSDDEQVYEFRKALRHTELFSKLSASDSRKLVEELEKFEKMKPEIAIRIADIIPESNDELRAIYAKERFTISDEELTEILDLIKQYK